MSFTRTRHGGLWVPPHIIHRDRWLDAQDPVVMTLGLKGRLIVELIEAATGKVKRRLEFDNLITDAGLNGIGNVGTVLALTAWAGCGTGSTAPANSDTALVTEITPASTNRTNLVGGGTESSAYTAGANDYWEKSIVREFSTSQANGNLTEIGFFSANTAGTMFMRQLFKDGGGTPTTVVKTSSDILRITYKLRIHPPPAATDPTGSITISGTSYTWTLRALSVSSSFAWGGQIDTFGGWSTAGNAADKACEDGTLVARTATTMTGSQSQAPAPSWAAYVANNFFRDRTCVWGISIANFATGIGGTTIYCDPGSAQGLFQVLWSPKFAKDATKQLTLVHRISWARYP